MKKDSRYKWYVVDMIVFTFINIIVIFGLRIDVVTLIRGVEWSSLIILGLGVWRLSDVITQESVTEVIRAPFMEREIVDGKETWVMATEGLRGFWGTLLSCNACMGVWVALFTFYLFLFFPIPITAFMAVMVLTSLERFLSKLYNFLEKRG